jgi:hypothetical protein
MLEEALELAAEVTEAGTQEARDRGGGAFAAYSDEELAADMCARWPHLGPSRELVRTTYRIGSGRAWRILSRWASSPSSATERQWDRADSGQVSTGNG